MIRLVPNQAAQVRRAPLVSFQFDGTTVSGHEGESLVAALMRSGHLTLRQAPRDGAPRGAFCCMGLCQECAVVLDGQTVEACRVPVSAGLEVRKR